MPAGRKAKSPYGPRVHLTMRVDPDLHKWLKAQDKMSDLVNNVLRRAMKSEIKKAQKVLQTGN